MRTSLQAIALATTLATTPAAAVMAGCSTAEPPRPAESAATIVSTDLAFRPTELKMKVNQPQVLRLDNRGKLLHDLTVDTMAVTAVKAEGSATHDMGGHSGAVMMPPGSTMGGGMMRAGTRESALHIAAEAGHVATIEFTPTEAGTYVFYCTVPGHREAGMEGRLIVG